MPQSIEFNMLYFEIDENQKSLKQDNLMKKVSEEISGLQPYLVRILKEHYILNLEDLVEAYPDKLMTFYRFGYTSLRKVEAILPGRPRLERISQGWSGDCKCNFCVNRAEDFRMKKSMRQVQKAMPMRNSYREYIRDFRENIKSPIGGASNRYEYGLVLQLAKFMTENQDCLSSRDVLMLVKVGGHLYKSEMRNK